MACRQLCIGPLPKSPKKSRQFGVTSASRGLGPEHDFRASRSQSRRDRTGGCGTLHANSPGDVPQRFDALGALAGMPRAAVQTQLASAVEVVVHLARADGARRVASISVLRWTGSETRCEVALELLGTGSSRLVRTGSAWPELAALAGVDP